MMPTSQKLAPAIRFIIMSALCAAVATAQAGAQDLPSKYDRNTGLEFASVGPETLATSSHPHPTSGWEFREESGQYVRERRVPYLDDAKAAWDIDVLGQAQVSRYNFTDLKKTYEGADAYMVIKPAWWLNEARTFGVYGEIIPVGTTEDEFWFQRYVQLNMGLQWYPFDKPVSTSPFDEYLRAIRIFVQGGYRGFYDEEKDADPQRYDWQVGFDYYYDNIFTEEPTAVFVYNALSFRSTNHSLPDYDGVIWSGNVKIGPKVWIGDALLVPYAVADWTYSPRYEERWFENFLRIGGGVRLYPFADSTAGRSPVAHDLLRRLHVYVEGVHNASWLGASPPSDVEDNDIRIGISFSTGGFFRDARLPVRRR